MDPTNNPIPSSNTPAGGTPVPPVDPVAQDSQMVSGGDTPMSQGSAVAPSAQGGIGDSVATVPVASVPNEAAFRSLDPAPVSPAPRVTIPVSSPAPETAPAQSPVAPVGGLQPVEVPVPVHPVINPTAQDTVGASLLPSSQVGATDPIMMPDSGASLDPVEQELNAPMKAAAPVPGSIGSAVSGPADNAIEGVNPFADSSSPHSVPFNDPAAPVEDTQNAAVKEKKKSSKTTLIALIMVAVMIIIALVGVLVFQLMSNNQGGWQANSGGNSSVVDNGGNSGGSGNASGQNGSNSNSSNANAKIVCQIEPSAESIDERIKSREATFKIVDNKFSEAEVSITFINENGEEETTSQVLSMGDLFGSADGSVEEDEFIEGDGTLKVTTDVFADKLSTALSESDTDNTYTCAVEG